MASGNSDPDSSFVKKVSTVGPFSGSRMGPAGAVKVLRSPGIQSAISAFWDDCLPMYMDARVRAAVYCAKLVPPSIENRSSLMKAYPSTGPLRWPEATYLRSAVTSLEARRFSAKVLLSVWSRLMSLLLCLEWSSFFQKQYRGNDLLQVEVRAWLLSLNLAWRAVRVELLLCILDMGLNDVKEVSDVSTGKGSEAE